MKKTTNSVQSKDHVLELLENTSAESFLAPSPFLLLIFAFFIFESIFFWKKTFFNEITFFKRNKKHEIFSKKTYTKEFLNLNPHF